MGAWLNGDLSTVRTMWARGRPSRDIAAALVRPVSRNAVMGMVNRLGLMGLGHADDARLAAMDRVALVLDGEFSMDAPLHRQALLSFLVARTPRSVEALALASGVARPDVARFLERLPLVWPERSAMPSEWSDGLDGMFAFVLDMAVVAGVIDARPVRPGRDDGTRLAA